MDLFFFDPTKKHPDEEHPQVIHQEPQHNISEGSEFLDDAIRMKDQPLIYTENSIATGSPEGLL